MANSINTFQPALVLHETIARVGVFPSQGGFNGMTMAMFHTYAFGIELAGAPSVNGQLLPINQNQALFALLGTTYGGNGQTTFALPDLGARTAVSTGQGPGLANIDLGQQAGSPSALLTQSQMPQSYGGTAASFNDGQPELGIRYLIRDEGIFPSPNGSGGSLTLIGSVVKFAGNFDPGGYLECNGQLLDIASHQALFAIIGTTYGGDGQTTFAVPDLRGRTVAGTGGFLQLGDNFGVENVAISQANLPLEMGGSGIPINNQDPSLALNYCIALQGIFPSPENGASDSEPFIGEIITFAGNFAPSGFAFCRGQLLSINQNQALFALLGTTYGGNGQTTFALPDLRDRIVVGDGSSVNLGEVLGSDIIQLTQDDIPSLTIVGSNLGETQHGGGSADNIQGLGGNDTLFGLRGTDTLNGGTGEDTMVGGADSDFYFVDNILDVVTEAANGGTADRVLTTISYTLATDQQIELFSTTNSLGLDAINLTGNNLANTILGNNGINVLNGGGGVDRMTGLNGNDLYYVDNASDGVIETAGGGTADRVLTSVTYLLGVDQQIELFSTTDSNGLDAINLTGNNLANTILGNNGINVLNGGGGVDRMTGLNGNDLYYVDNASGGVIEIAGGGTADRVLTSVTYLLGVDQQIELFSTTNSLGLDSINLTGNNIANRILGNNGVNTINGGLSSDFLTGGLGADQFVFNTAITGGGNVDTISDFTHLADDMQLSQAIFTGIGATLDATELRLGSTAIATTQHIVYDSATGNLFFDADGSGAAAQVQFAKVTANTVLDINDFIMI